MKSTNNLTPQFWGKRKPMTHYFEKGYVTFSMDRKTKKLKYDLKYVTLVSHDTITKGIVKDKAHLDRLLSLKSFNYSIVEAIPTRNEVLQ